MRWYGTEGSNSAGSIGHRPGDRIHRDWRLLVRLLGEGLPPRLAANDRPSNWANGVLAHPAARYGAVAALRDGINDAKFRRSPYCWTLLTNPFERAARLYEGLISTAKVVLLGLCMDAIYQWIVLKIFYPAEALIVALALAFLPYLLLRGPIARIARWRLGAASTHESR